MDSENKVNILIEVSEKDQIQIENICTEQNKTLSQYFLELHTLNIQNQFLVKSCESEDDKKEVEHKKLKRK